MRTLLVFTSLTLTAMLFHAAEPTKAGTAPGDASVAPLPLPPGALRKFGDDRFRVGNTKTGKRLRKDGIDNRLRFAVTPNGSQLAVGDLAGRLEVWDVATGQVLRQLNKGH